MKFLNTQQKHTLENFMDSYQEQLKSPFMTSTNINKSIKKFLVSLCYMHISMNSV